jgi:copper chaperone NosL
MREGSILMLLVLSVAIFMGCEPKPQNINYGSDECAYCRMMITDAEFGSQILNNQGRSYKFDSVECMTAYDLTEEGGNFHSKWVPNFLNREEWLMAENAVYLHSETLRSPMGLFLSAYLNREAAEEMKAQYGGEIVNYETVKQIIEREWLSNGSDNRQMMNN